MARVASPSLARQLGSLFEGGSAAGLSDRQLLDRFTARDDPAAEAAFAAIVARHGPMVLGVCRQLLGDHHHAEDAFQAVFLVLARGARSIRDPDRLGAWLYGVAVRTARKARGRLARRRQTEEAGAVGRPEARPAVQAEQLIDREQAEALHREIDRLPGSFRLAVVLCYFEGLSPDEAAERLRWPGGTLRSRLVRARDRLRRGLARRGIALSATGPAAPASISPPLCDITTRAALKFAAGQATSSTATALAQEVLRSMLIHKLKLTLLTVVCLVAVATGAGYLAHALAMEDEPRSNPQPRPAAKTEDTTRRPAPGRMFVVGRVLDSQGKPVPGAPVEVIGRPRKVYSAADGFGSSVLLGRGESDADGRFRLDAARTSSVGFFDGLYALTTAPGSGIGWASLNPDAEQPSAEIRLRPEQIIRGKLVNLSGQPAAGVELHVNGFGEARNLGRWSETTLYGNTPDADARTWPRPPKTDDQGRFAIHGVGRGHFVSFVVDDLRFAQQWLGVPTDDRDGPIEVTLALQPAKIVEGRVLAADTGQPIPAAVIEVGADTKTGTHPAIPRRCPGTVPGQSLPGRPLHRDRLSTRRTALSALAGGIRMDQGRGQEGG